MSLPVSYRVSMPRPHSHLFEVQAHFPPTGEELVATLPVWTPGSYLVREYSRHVQELTATAIDDKPLAMERIDKHTVRVKTSNKPARLHYKVYANELTVRTSHLDGTHGYFNGATLFFYSEALRNREHRVAIHAPPRWQVTTALESQGMEFLAPNYDELVDAPFEIGPHEKLEFTAAGVPHEVVLWGDPLLDEKKLLVDLQRICETEAQLFGGLPMKRYVFFVYGTDKMRGGLEHKASTALVFPRNGFNTSKGWEDFLTLAAHEYFHLWNVKRIKPQKLVPFDYSQENYTGLLWAFEGGTSYYDMLLVRRAGLMPTSRYLLRLGESLTALHTTPGRKVMSLIDASFLSWVKHYRPDENTPNTAISYYLKGEIVCLLLDLHLRKLTKNQQSLDDVMRLLWAKYGDEKGVPEDGIEKAAAEVAGSDLSAFFNQALRSTEELDYSVFSHVGLEAKFRTRESTNDKGGSPPRAKAPDEKQKGYLGVTTRGSGTISTVFEGSPAMEAGLYADDELVALDGMKVDAGTLISRAEEKKPGEKVTVTVFRRDRLTEVEVTLGQKPADAVYLQRLDRPTDEQKASYKAWLGASWDENAEAIRATS
ncbi:MAG: PDZ domain-containing protein [Myxococcaceae bacterium]|nr:PDZ domain-containing protein [Myxococcaceae bacterium]